jgi:hypothetical protein
LSCEVKNGRDATLHLDRHLSATFPRINYDGRDQGAQDFARGSPLHRGPAQSLFEVGHSAAVKSRQVRMPFRGLLSHK